MNLTQLEPEEKLLVARMLDIVRIAAERGSSRFSSFLNERQQILVKEVVRRRQLEGCLFYGGYPDAVRCMFGAFPEWQEPVAEDFPITPITIWLPRSAEITHRDVLGSLIALRITRESIGDILIEQPLCHVFVKQEHAPLILDELHKVGGAGVRCEIATDRHFERREQFEEKRITVHSVRLDALVSAMTGVSREKGAAFIKAELVQCNYGTVHSGTADFSPGDVITIHGYGKYIVDDIGKPTKKGRLPVLFRKYI